MRPLSLEQMKRVDLYIRVEVELEEDDKIEKVAAEICRQIKKNNVVRTAEFSNAVSRD
jgi:phosphoribosylformylglycinamidine (FGAM) synthase PurS component